MWLGRLSLSLNLSVCARSTSSLAVGQTAHRANSAFLTRSLHTCGVLHLVCAVPCRAMHVLGWQIRSLDAATNVGPDQLLDLHNEVGVFVLVGYVCPHKHLALVWCVEKLSL